MKGGKTIYFLLPVVLLLWGYIGWKVYYSLHEKENQNAVLAELPSLDLDVPVTTDTLKANYRDPFLGDPYQPSKANTAGKAIGKAVKKPVVSSLPWPQIILKSIIVPTDGRKRTCIVKINGQDQFLREGNEFAGVKVLKINSTGIDCVFGGEKKFISR